MQDSTRYDKTQSLLEKYDPDYEAPTPRKPLPAPLPRQVTPGPMAPLPHQVRRLPLIIFTIMIIIQSIDLDLLRTAPGAHDEGHLDPDSSQQPWWLAVCYH